MDMPHCSLRVLHKDRTATLRVEGRGTLQQSSAIRGFAEKCLACGVTALLLDLRQCTYMDSTFLGTLLFLRRLAERRGKAELALVSPSPECCRLLEQVGVQEFFPTVGADAVPSNEDWTPLPQEPVEASGLKSNVVQAHRELAALPGAAGDQFRAVAACLAAESKTPPT